MNKYLAVLALLVSTQALALPADNELKGICVEAAYDSGRGLLRAKNSGMPMEQMLKENREWSLAHGIPPAMLQAVEEIIRQLYAPGDQEISLDKLIKECVQHLKTLKVDTK